MERFGKPIAHINGEKIYEGGWGFRHGDSKRFGGKRKKPKRIGRRHSICYY